MNKATVIEILNNLTHEQKQAAATMARWFCSNEFIKDRAGPGRVKNYSSKAMYFLEEVESSENEEAFGFLIDELSRWGT